MSKDEDHDVHIALEDQQKINRFARLNNRLEDLKDELSSKKSAMQTIDDASTDIMMLEDDDEKVPYMVGEVLVMMTQDEVQAALEQRKADTEAEAKDTQEKMDAIKEEMSDLKTKLYAKFGDAINLEADED